jgi:hypothetical protein
VPKRVPEGTLTWDKYRITEAEKKRRFSDEGESVLPTYRPVHQEEPQPTGD